MKYEISFYISLANTKMQPSAAQYNDAPHRLLVDWVLV